MKSFLIKLASFVLVPLLTLLVVYGLKQLSINQTFKDLSQTYTVVLVGDSQIQRVNPEYFGVPTLNFAGSGEPYFVSYAKLKRLLDGEDHAIQTVILGVSPHNFSPAYQRLTQPQTSEGQRTLKAYLHLMDLWESSNFQLPGILFNPSFHKAFFKTPEWEGLIESSHENPDEAIISKNLKMFSAEGEPIDSSHQMRYLEAIIALCNDHNVKLIALSTPVHSRFAEQIPREYEELLSTFIQNHPQLEHMDLRSVDLDPSFYSDGNHLNRKGAALISQRISTYIGDVLIQP